MAMAADRAPSMDANRRSGDTIMVGTDRTQEFRKAGRRTAIVRALRVVLPVGAVALLGLYGLSIVRTAGLIGSETLTGVAIRKILPEDLAMKNPRYEGFTKDGGSYVFSAATAQQDPTLPNVVKLNGIVGEVFQADKTRTDITATRGVFNNEKSVLDLYEEINVDSQSGLKARLTRATILTKEDLLTSDEPVLVEFPNGSVRSNKMTLRQKAREATFVENVEVVLTPPPEKASESAGAEGAPAKQDDSALFAPSNGPINIGAHRLDIDDAGKAALFTGNVRAEQAGSFLTTPELKVFYEGEGMMGGAAPDGASAAPGQSGKVRRIVAHKPVVMQRANGDLVTSDAADFDAQAETAVLVGEVVMTSGTDRRASSERVEIDQAGGTIQLVGNVIVAQGDNMLRGGRLAINRTAGTAKLTTPPGAAAGPGRVSARLRRDDGQAGAGKARRQAPGKEEAGAMGSFRTNPNAPVDLEADSLDVDDAKKVAVFRGDVDAKQDGFTITCAELSAFYKGEAGLLDAAAPGTAPKESGGQSAELTRIEARKNVRVASKDGQTATGDWADFDAKANKVVMGGNVVLSKGKSMVRGTRLVIDLTTGESKIDTALESAAANAGGRGASSTAPAGQAANKGRASAVFFPEELKNDEQAGGGGAAGGSPAAGAIDGWSATASPDGSVGGPAN